MKDELDLIPNRVNRGVAFLDLVSPNWRKDVVVQMLDLGSCSNCVLGQLFDQYYHGLDIIIPQYTGETKENYHERSEKWALEMGFMYPINNHHGDHEYMQELTREWTKRITACLS